MGFVEVVECKRSRVWWVADEMPITFLDRTWRSSSRVVVDGFRICGSNVAMNLCGAKTSRRDQARVSLSVRSRGVPKETLLRTSHSISSPLSFTDDSFCCPC